LALIKENKIILNLIIHLEESSQSKYYYRRSAICFGNHLFIWVDANNCCGFETKKQNKKMNEIKGNKRK
jgi:hypothetical protein